jgi:hypothetical protein
VTKILCAFAILPWVLPAAHMIVSIDIAG